MNDAQLHQLLPACSVTLFSSNAQTAEAFAHLCADWRSASLTCAVHKGGIQEAQNHYKNGNASPDLLIVETSETGADALVAQLEELAGHCSEGTAAILIGPENDVNLYRRLTRMGVLDYLVTPVAFERLMEVVATAALDRHGIADNLMTVVMGSRGGGGTTTVASLIAHGLANAGRKTALCDLLPGRSALPVLWGTECPGGLADLAKAFQSGDISALYRLAPKAMEHLHLFTPATDTPFDFALGHDDQMNLLQGLRQHFPNLVYDTAGFTPKILKSLIPTAPNVVMVTPPTVTGLRAAKKFMTQIEPLRGGEAGAIKIVLNRCKELGSDELRRKDIESALGQDAAVEITYDKTLAAKLENGGWRDYAPAHKITHDLMTMIGLDANGPAPAKKKGGLMAWLGE